MLIAAIAPPACGPPPGGRNHAILGQVIARIGWSIGAILLSLYYRGSAASTIGCHKLLWLAPAGLEPKPYWRPSRNLTAFFGKKLSRLPFPNPCRQTLCFDQSPDDTPLPLSVAAGAAINMLKRFVKTI